MKNWQALAILLALLTAAQIIWHLTSKGVI
ncbi:hypothetical protein UFOVP507_27 [uncultured Caudovirales phage]|uniref:Uncharacterized protein n=1 Tax=uncultured Caudovirales phage TaxID=2100421 RepID=A0A6J5MJP6_9CAUD|nr:hypothetical protein UFOVP507_27 [uncultured Caudovirales phage]